MSRNLHLSHSFRRQKGYFPSNGLLMLARTKDILMNTEARTLITSCQERREDLRTQKDKDDTSVTPRSSSTCWRGT